MSLPIDDRLCGERVQCYISEDEEEVEQEVNRLKIEKSHERQRQNQQKPQTGLVYYHAFKCSHTTSV